MACRPRQLLCPCCSLVHLMFSKTEIGGFAWSHDNCRFLLLTKSCSASDLLATRLNWIVGLLGMVCLCFPAWKMPKQRGRQVQSKFSQRITATSALGSWGEFRSRRVALWLIPRWNASGRSNEPRFMPYKFANPNVGRPPRSVVCSWTPRLWKGCWFGLSRRR